jgi:hypothetical protein
MELLIEVPSTAFDDFRWEKVMIYTPGHFVFSISRENYIKMKLSTVSEFFTLEQLLKQSANFSFVCEDLRILDWTEVAEYLKFETFLDSEASDILANSLYKMYPDVSRQKHRASKAEKRIRLMKLLGKNKKLDT